MSILRIKTIPLAILFFVLVLTRSSAKAQFGGRQAGDDVAAPIEPLSADIDETRLFTELLSHNELRNSALAGYTEQRTYQVTDMSGRVRAEESGQMEYRAPDRKTFAAKSESGSVVVRRLALNPLIASEIDAASRKQHHDSAITPENYTLELLGEQQVGPYRCILARATPKRTDKYLFAGEVWIDTQDYAVVRIVGHPAKKLSFWIERVDFVREYQKIDGFWLPQKDETHVQVRMYGQKVLTIDHQNYIVTGVKDQIQNAEN
jgi:hypothetical protein